MNKSLSDYAERLWEVWLVESCIVGTEASSLLGLTCLEKTAISSLKDSEEQTSPPATPGSRGVHVANSHFSKINASSGNKGCLQRARRNATH